MKQQSLFDKAAGERQRDDAIDKVHRGNADFVELAVVAIRRVAARNYRFTTDAVWAELQGVDAPREARALGAAMRIVQAEGLIIPTSEYKPSLRPACHRRPLRVWQAKEQP